MTAGSSSAKLGPTGSTNTQRSPVESPSRASRRSRCRRRRRRASCGRLDWREVAMSAEYVVLIEQGPSSFGAYCPDLPGVAAAADTFDEVVALMREAIPAHIAGLIEDGLPVPPPSRVTTVLVDPAA